MLSIENTNLGESIKVLRRVRGMSRIELSEAVGISESYLRKLESGMRYPGIHTYLKIIEILGADIVVRDLEKTVKGECVAKAQQIFMGSTENQALFMLNVLECIVQSIELIK